MGFVLKRQKDIRLNNKYCLLLQDKWVAKMISLTLNLSRKELIVSLIAFIVITSSICIAILYRSFTDVDKPIKMIRISKPTK